MSRIRIPMRTRLPIGRIGFPSRGRGRLRVWPLILFALFAVYYVLSHQETVPVTGRTQLVDLSPQQEAALGLQSYKTILAQSELVTSGPELERVRRIGQRIAAVSGAENFDWEFNLIKSDQVNAFCLPGGKVAVYTGILPVAKNENGLAAILGHEIAHAIARHGAERISHQKLAQFGSMAVGMAVSEMDFETRRAVMGALGVGTQFGVLLPFSRKHESEADYIGLLYLAKACFDPAEAPLLWERMAKANSAAQMELLSTHPAPETRIAQLKQWLPEALSTKSKHCPVG